MNYRYYFLLFSSLFSWKTLAQNSFTDSKTNIQFIFKIEPNMFPANWYNNEIKAKVNPIDKSEISRSIKVFRKTIGKYPTEVLKKNLKKVYVVKNLTFYDNVPFGGTYSAEKFALYISNNGIQKGYTDQYLEQTFHHEFSSILLENYREYFDKSAWEAINGKNFQYGKGGVSAIQNNQSSTSFDDESNEKGFLSQYSQSDLEEDVNIFAENLFKARPNFWEIVEENPKLKQKLAIMVKFYQSISPTFNLDYFKKISVE